jgi:DNA mismatch repair protein MutS
MTARFQSILFEREGGAGVRADEPAYFADLNLDQVVAAITTGREQYDLEPFFYAPLHDVGAVRYRHEVLRDLERPDLLEGVRAFAGAMGRVRTHLTAAEKGYYPLAKQGWFLDAAEVYCEAIGALAGGLASPDVSSCGFEGLRAYLAEYAASERFTRLAAETKTLKQALAAIRYAVRIQGAKVIVGTYDGEADYGTEVEETFAKFRQGESPFCGAFAEPSDGLEPSTRSLPWRIGLRPCDAGKALSSALSLQIGSFLFSLLPSLEGP